MWRRVYNSSSSKCWSSLDINLGCVEESRHIALVLNAGIVKILILRRCDYKRVCLSIYR